MIQFLNNINLLDSIWLVVALLALLVFLLLWVRGQK